MKKIFLLLICIIYLIFSIHYSFANTPIENVFFDINKEYKYYKELQFLYDRDMILNNEDGLFKPNKLLNRDEFVGISQEVVCKKCINSNDVYSSNNTNLYGTETFFDVATTNKYYYCIVLADKNNFVVGYDKGHSCEDGTYKASSKPFCVNNKITLEEAIAVILRNSGIFTIEDNEKIINKIHLGEKFPILSDDVSFLNKDGTPYTFYGYLKKALDYELVEYDKNGDKKTYKLLEKKDNKINPKKSITKQEFLKIAYIAFKSNSCLEKQEDKLALKIDILDKSCKKEDTNCNISKLDAKDDIYDLKAIVSSQICESGINSSGYMYRFYNNDSGEEIKKYGEYIDDYKFLSKGNWRIYLKVTDNCGNTGEIYNTLYIGGGLKVGIQAYPISGNAPLKVDFEGIVSGGKKNYSYEWDFGDGNKFYGKKATNVFLNIQTYKITLTVSDKNGNIADSTLTIRVNSIVCNKDIDGDKINDCNDKCPLIIGERKNDGCPLFNSFSKLNYGGCEYKNKSVVVSGNAICNICPCSNFLDFNSDLKKCDLVFPAISSPDSKNIYSRGDFWEIR